MFLRLSRFLVLLAAVQILGGHWVALQSVAWVGMVADYAQGSTLGAALEKTFDGAHPCALCEVVKKGRSEEKKQDEVKLLLKLEALLPPSVQLPAPRVCAVSYPESESAGIARSLAPLTPPPLAA